MFKAPMLYKCWSEASLRPRDNFCLKKSMNVSLNYLWIIMASVLSSFLLPKLLNQKIEKNWWIRLLNMPLSSHKVPMVIMQFSKLLTFGSLPNVRSWFHSFSGVSTSLACKNAHLMLLISVFKRRSQNI